MAVTVHIDQTEIDRAFADMEPSSARHKTALRKSGVALSLLIQGFNSRTRVGATERYSHVQEQEGFNSRTRVGATL